MKSGRRKSSWDCKGCKCFKAHLERTWIALKGLLAGIWMLILTLARTEMRNMLLETRGKAILVRKWQKTWLNYVLKFCRKQNLWVMTLDIWQRRSVSKVLKVQPGFSLLITVKYEGREIMAIFFFFFTKRNQKLNTVKILGLLYCKK